MRPILCLAILVLCLPALVSAEPTPPACTALQAELDTLRAQLHRFEAAEKIAAPIAVLNAEAVLPGTVAKPPATQILVIEQPYSKTGCRLGLFQAPARAKWQDTELWLDLEKELSPAAVEALLGSEHYDVRGGDNVIWQYGKCGASSQAQVMFSNSKLADWRAPEH